MIGQCRDYLIGRLQTAGIKSRIHTSMKELRTSQESHIGAVLFEGDSFTRNGSAKVYLDADGNKQKRRKVFDRQTTFVVVIGEYEQAKCEEIFENFLASLDKGIVIDGNYTGIEVEEADWVDKDDSILKAKIAVQVRIRFDGGVYKDTGFAKITGYEIERVEVENTKEAEDEQE